VKTCGATARLLTSRVDRRVLVKASAAFAAMSATSIARPQVSKAQEAASTLAADWYEVENIGSVDASSFSDPRDLQADFTFFAAAPHWGGEGDPNATVQMSFSQDGQNWMDPISVGAATGDAGQPEADGRLYGHLVITDAANYIRYQAFDANGEVTQLPELAFTYIDAIGGPTIDDVYSAALEPSIQQPPIITREMWGADERYRHVRQTTSKPILWPPEYQTVEHVIIHHTVTPNFQDPLVAIRSVYYYHAVTRGWGDIGYNYLVDFMGNVYEGRYGGDNVVGGHAYQYAHGSSGISLLGTFDNVSETPEAQSGLIWITAWVSRDLDPFGKKDFHETDNLPTICGHRDVWDSTCPGDAAYADLEWIRQSVADVLASDVDPEPHPRFTEGDQAQVSSDTANLRSGPGTSYDILAILAYAAAVTIVDGPTTNSGYTWYEVQSDDGSGWVAEDLLQNVADAPSAGFDPGDHVQVNTDFLNLRSSASTTGSIIAAMPSGTKASVVNGPESGSGKTWYQLETDYGKGWAVGLYLKRTSGSSSNGSGEFKEGDKVFVDTDMLNLRSGPGAGKSIIATLTQGYHLMITGGPERSGDYDWYSVSGAVEGEGWCAGDFISKIGAPELTFPGEFENGQIVVVDTDLLRLRSGPGLDKPTLAYMPTGTQLKVLGGPRHADAEEWYKVRSSIHGEGWCVAEFLSALNVTTLGFGDSVKVIDGELNLRVSPSTSGDVKAVLADGTKLKITGGIANRDGVDWFPVHSEKYGPGWCAAQFLQPI
jgi:uncharacterized protein YgiM (DUF1202 family)